MKKTVFFILFLLASGQAFPYSEVFNPHTGRLDKVGVDASGDIAVPCPSGQVLLSSGGGTWACGTTSGSGAPTDAQYIVMTGNGSLSAERVLTSGDGVKVAQEPGIARLSYDTAYTPTLAAAMAGNGVLNAGSSLNIASGDTSITVNPDSIAVRLKTVSQDSASATTVSPSGLEVATGATMLQGCSDGQVLQWEEATDVWRCTTVSGSGAPTDAQYVTLATNGSLSNERVLTGGEGIHLIDAGAGGSITVSLDRLTTSGDALSATTVSPSGTEIISDRVTLLQGCSDGQILKWEESSDTWKCQADSSGGTPTLYQGSHSSTSFAATNYVPLFGGDANTTSTNVDEDSYPVDITVTKFGACVDAAPGAGQHWTVSIQEAGTPSTAACTINETDECCASGTISEAITARTKLNVKFNEDDGSAASTGGESWQWSFTT